MAMYARDASTGLRPIDRWDGGVGWLAHPDETGMRAGHALVGDGDGAWVFDPLDAPGLDDLLAEVGEVAGVAVLSSFHARDADAVARRHGVPVHVPRWTDRGAARTDAPVERYDARLGDSGFRILRSEPFPGWQEAFAPRESDGTLVVPDTLGTAPLHAVGDERLGVTLVRRLQPPRDALGGLDPERILVGHGSGLFEDAAALSDALSGARRRLPRALTADLGAQVRALVAALGD